MTRRATTFGDPSPAAARTRGTVAGLVLVPAVLVVLLVTLPFVQPDAGTWATLGVIAAAAVLVCTLVTSSLVPARAGVRHLLAVPFWLFAAVGFLARSAPQAGVAYVPLFVLGFAYIGVFTPRRTAWAALPAAWLAYLPTLPSFGSAAAVRVLLVTLAWMTLAELLAGLMAKQVQAQGLLRELSHADALTGLPNRRALDERLTRLGVGDALAIVDFDDFKLLNDTCGHAAGDTQLAEFGLFLRVHLRAGDFAARYGGEEFVLVWPDTQPAEAEAALGRLRSRWTLLSDQTFSAGLVGADHRWSDTLLRADAQLYRAKDAGKNRTARADPVAS